MKRIQSCLILLMVWLLHSVLSAASIPIIMGQETGANGEALPISPLRIEMVKLLAKETGLDLVITPYPWRRAQLMSSEGRGIIWGQLRTPETDAQYVFSPPIYTLYFWLVTRADQTFHYAKLEDLKGKTLSIPSDSHYEEAFEAVRGDWFQIEDGAKSLEKRLLMLDIGRANVLVLTTAQTDRTKLEQRLNCDFGHINQWRVLAKPMSKQDTLLAAAKHSRFLVPLATLSKAIERLHASGAIEQLLNERNAQSVKQCGTFPPAATR
ncbi:transporter substrate-binding domain-containing protein [Burkholderiaceae bacterium DAT-1]|nr:transporter substrate-binding domain-containing protein [Burkholderiaceae bacterium DAT-1]